MSFASLGLSPFLVKKLAGLDYKEPYPIQSAAIPQILKGKDILGIAPTGSGKTASYVLPILHQQMGKSVVKNRHVNAVIVVPTRELAIQVGEVVRVLSEGLPERVKSLAVYGGVSLNPQMIALQGVQVLVATPGRLLELVEMKAISLSLIDTFVLDEADKMLNLGFKQEVDEILAFLPQKRQNLLFSATLSGDVKYVTRLLLNDPEVIDIEGEELDLEQIKQVAYIVEEKRKGPLLRHLIRDKKMKQVLVFCSSVYKADSVTQKLRANKINAAAIHSKKSQGARFTALDKFKNGELNVLVATDLIARGIDIELLPYVINYELPRSPKDYIHRIGRTGRADANGEAISLISDEEKQHFRVIQKKMKRWVNSIDATAMDF